MYFNIFAEMARMQLDCQKLAKYMQITPELLRHKLMKKKVFTIKEVFKMQNIFRKEHCTFEYLLRERR